MNRKKTNSISILLFWLLALTNTLSFAQDLDCSKEFAALQELAQKDNFGESVYKPWLDFKKKCPQFNESFFIIGEKILSQKLDQANTAGEKDLMIAELLQLYDEYDKAFPHNKNGNKINRALVLFENKKETSNDVFIFLNKAFVTENAQFTKPNVLNIYFELLLKQYESGNKEITLDEVFQKYREVSEKAQSLKQNNSQIEERLTLKSETGILSDSEKIELRNAKTELKELTLVSQNINGGFSTIVDCKTLEDYYKKNLEKNKANALWLQNASETLKGKTCKSEIHETIIRHWHELAPSAASSYEMGLIARSGRDMPKAIEYFSQAADLQSDPNKKAELYYMLASSYGNKNKEMAKESIKKSLLAKPSMGKAYIYLSQLYANSEKECGANAFEKKAIYWLASQTAKQAGIVEAALKKSADDIAAEFNKKAPSKDEVAKAGKKAGETITFSCWIDEMISIPKL